MARNLRYLLLVSLMLLSNLNATFLYQLYVLEGSAGSLLSYNTANDLGLIKLSVNATNGKPFASDTLKARSPKLFNGIGCLCNFEVKLHIDERIPPVAQAARRIPFHM